MNPRIALASAAVLFAAVAHASPTVVNFEDLTLPPNSFYNGSDEAGGFTSGGATFNNDYNSEWFSWSGWAYSNVNDTTTVGAGNQYAAYTGTDYSGSGIYAVAYTPSYSPAVINLPTGSTAQSVRVTNATYTALDLINGSFFSKQFGGVTGDDPDWLTVTFTGYAGLDAGGAITGSAEFYLADFRFEDNDLDYIINTWELLDLTPLGAAASIQLSMASSDVGDFGINTPTYVAIDNLTLIPEPGTILLLTGFAAVMARRRAHRNV